MKGLDNEWLPSYDILQAPPLEEENNSISTTALELRIPRIRAQWCLIEVIAAQSWTTESADSVVDSSVDLIDCTDHVRNDASIANEIWRDQLCCLEEEAAEIVALEKIR